MVDLDNRIGPNVRNDPSEAGKVDSSEEKIIMEIQQDSELDNEINKFIATDGDHKDDQEVDPASGPQQD